MVWSTVLQTTGEIRHPLYMSPCTRIGDWLGITTLSPDKWGPSLKNALVGPAEFYKNMLDNQKLRDENYGISHFKETLRPYFVKRVSYIFLWRFMYLFRCWRTNATDFITWILRFEVAVRGLQASWLDLTPLPPESQSVYGSVYVDLATGTAHLVDPEGRLQ